MQAFDFRLIEAGEFRLPAILRGPPAGPAVLLVPPLFEEMNRCRRLLADLGRALAERGIATVLPDLPGTGDCSGSAASAASWRAAVEALTVARPCHVFAMRGGALLADGNNALGLYRFAPVGSGAILLREMMRAQAIADQERSGGKVTPSAYEKRLAAGQSVELTGYEITPALAVELTTLSLPDAAAPCRVADLKPGADIVFDGPPVWRQADPAPSRALAVLISEDIAAWIR